MNISTAKRKAGVALREIIAAARRYVEAEDAFEHAIKNEKTPAENNDVKTGRKAKQWKGVG
jgi:hypothetical protein